MVNYCEFRIRTPLSKKKEEHPYPPVLILLIGTRRKVHKIVLTESSHQALDHPGLNSMNFCAENTFICRRNGWVYNSALVEFMAN